MQGKAKIEDPYSTAYLLERLPALTHRQLGGFRIDSACNEPGDWPLLVSWVLQNRQSVMLNVSPYSGLLQTAPLGACSSTIS